MKSIKVPAAEAKICIRKKSAPVLLRWMHGWCVFSEPTVAPTIYQPMPIPIYLDSNECYLKKTDAAAQTSVREENLPENSPKTDKSSVYGSEYSYYTDETFVYNLFHQNILHCGIFI